MIEINNRKLCESCFSEIDAAETCPCCGYNKSEFTPDPMVLPLGTKLNDKIVIGRVMGKGGFGITYLGYDLRMDKIIAVKEYYPNGISYRAPGGTEVAVADAKSAETFENGAEKFYTEAEMVSQFNGNPNIVSVYDYFRANSTVYLIMEYLSGITLKNYVKKHGKLTDGQAFYVMDKIVAALSITHSAGVLHRDISPDNIMICSDGKIKLIDFGAARQILTESSSNLTVVMKPGYTPIEQYTKKGKQGAWTDIYSLGVSMYYALTKVIIDDPYARMESDEEFDENKYKINDSLWTILKKCTMINASDRYGSAIDLRKALKSVSAPLTPETIELSAEDLKDEPEEKKDAVAHTTAAPLEDDIPATVMGSDSDIAEEIESFGSSAPDEGAVSVSDTSDDTRISAPLTVERAKPSKKKGKLIAAICSAAALVIVVVICVVVGIGSKKITVKFNEDYPGDYGFLEKGIEKQQLLKFGGDVKVTLNLRNVESDNLKCIQLSDGDWFSPNRRNIPVMAINKGPDPSEEEYNLWYVMYYDGQETFTFIISRDAIENINNSLRFGVAGMMVESAVLENYDPAEYTAGSSARVIDLDWKKQWFDSPSISKEFFQELGGDVRVVLDIEYNKMDYQYPRANISVMTYTPSDYCPLINVENTTPDSFRDDCISYYLGCDDVGVPDKFIFTISREEINKLGEQGMFFRSENLYIKSAALEWCK